MLTIGRSIPTVDDVSHFDVLHLTSHEKKFINDLAEAGKLQSLMNLRQAYSKRVDWTGMDRDRVIRHLNMTIQSMGVRFVPGRKK